MAVVLGGKGAISASAESALRGLGIAEVRRMAGPSAFATNQAFAAGTFAHGMGNQGAHRGHCGRLLGRAHGRGPLRQVKRHPDPGQRRGPQGPLAAGRRLPGRAGPALHAAYVFGGEGSLGKGVLADAQKVVAANRAAASAWL